MKTCSHCATVAVHSTCFLTLHTFHILLFVQPLFNLTSVIVVTVTSYLSLLIKYLGVTKEFTFSILYLQFTSKLKKI